jgi:flagellar biosynthesis/type III secretory pathway protein FliH
MRSSSKPAVYNDTALATQVFRWAPDDLASASVYSSVGNAGRDEHTHPPTPSEAELAEQQRLEQEARVQEAYAAGYDAGRLDGELAEGVRLRNAIAVAEQALDTVQSKEMEWQEHVAENISALAVAVARHIVGRETSTDVSVVADLVKRALVEFPIDQPMRIRVHPVDLSMLSSHTTSDGSPLAIAPSRDVRWLADANIKPGGCIVEGRERIVDGRIDTALERVYRRLTGTDA